MVSKYCHKYHRYTKLTCHTAMIFITTVNVLAVRKSYRLKIWLVFYAYAITVYATTPP